MNTFASSKGRESLTHKVFFSLGYSRLWRPGEERSRCRQRQQRRQRRQHRLRRLRRQRQQHREKPILAIDAICL